MRWEYFQYAVGWRTASDEAAGGHCQFAVEAEPPSRATRSQMQIHACWYTRKISKKLRVCRG